VSELPEGAIAIVDRTRAGEILCSPKRRALFAHLISIGGPWERPPAGLSSIATRLRLVFADAATQGAGGPSREDIERLVRFAQGVDLRRGGLLVQCQAGISRSSAAAMIILAVIHGPGREGDAARDVLRANPQARPNQRMLELGGDVLGRGDALVRAWSAVTGT